MQSNLDSLDAFVLRPKPQALRLVYEHHSELLRLDQQRNPF